MPKLNGPLFSLEAKGTTKKSLSYQNRPSGAAVTKYSKPGSKNPFNPSYKQLNQRSIIALLIAHWQSMTDLERLNWENAAIIAKVRFGGYAHFLKTAQKNLYRDHGLVLYCTLNGPSGFLTPDISGNNNLIFPNPPLMTQQAQPTPSKNKHYGSALLFDGSAQYLESQDKPLYNFGTGNFTIEILIKTSTALLTGALLSKGTPLSAQKGWILFRPTTTYYQIRVSNGLALKFANKAITAKLNWVHLCATIDRNSNLILYANGKPGTATSLVGYTGSLDNLSPIWINNPDNPVPGILDEPRIYNRALTAGEVLRHYNMFKAAKK